MTEPAIPRTTIHCVYVGLVRTTDNTLSHKVVQVGPDDNDGGKFSDKEGKVPYLFPRRMKKKFRVGETFAVQTHRDESGSTLFHWDNLERLGSWNNRDDVMIWQAVTKSR